MRRTIERTRLCGGGGPVELEATRVGDTAPLPLLYRITPILHAYADLTRHAIISNERE